MTTILTKKKDTTGAPAPGDLTNAAGGAELAVNTFDKRLYTKNGSGTVVEIGTNPTILNIDDIQVDGNTISSTNTNGNINITPNGTGSVVVSKLQVTGGFQLDGNVTVGDSSADTLTVNSTITSNLIFTDNTYDIGASGATRPRSLFLGTNLTVGSLTSTRVPYASTGGLLVDSANMTFNGTTLTVADFTDSSLTSGRVTYAGTGGNLVDSANLTWNGSTLGITGALTASADSSFTSTGALLISKGTTGEQPGSPATGMIRYNTTTSQFEGYSGSSPAWKSIGGSALSNDTSTASTLYPVFAGATTGTAENLYTSNAKLLYKPSTGELSASIPRASNGIFVNTATVSTSYTVATGDNAMSAGVITIANGVTVTVSDGSRWTVI
jgi:hypothetical protein